MLVTFRRWLQSRPVTVVATVFAIYTLLITGHSIHAWQQMVEDAERYLLEDLERAVVELGSLVDRFDEDNGMHANVYEIQAFLQNRDLGMSMRYGLGASLLAIEHRFRDHLESHQSDQRILFYSNDGELLVDTAAERELPSGLVERVSAGRAAVWFDWERKLVVAIKPVRYKNESGGMVVSIDSPAHVLQPMSLAGSQAWREIVTDADTRHWLAPTEPPMFSAMLRSIVDVAQQRVEISDGIVAAWLGREQVVIVRQVEPEYGLQLVKVLPTELVYGHIPSLDALIAAAGLPLLMLWGAHRLDRMRQAAERLTTEVALSNQRREFVEQRNAQLASEIERRERLERALKTSEERWMLAVTGANDGIWDWRPASGETFFSERWKKLLGHDDDEITADIDERDRRIHPDDRLVVVRRMQHHLQGKTRFYQCEYRMRHKAGHYVWVLERGQALKDAQGNVSRVTGSMSDISERRKAESLLEERNVQLNTIFEISPDGMVSFGPDERVTYVNPAFLRMINRDMTDVRGLSEADFVVLMNRLCVAGQRFRSLAEMQDNPLADNQRETIALQGPGERILAIKLAVSGLASVSKILFFRDVTVEAEVDRMKTEFVSTAAHELRTPLASIYGYAELLVAESRDESRPRLFAETIFREAGVVASIIDDLLDLARIESRRGADFVFERLELGQLVDSVVSAYPAPRGRQAPRLKAPARACWVRADGSKIRQCCNNILSNAYKYSPDGGDIEVELRETAGECAIIVSDSGIGMNAGQLERIFERFYRADSAGTIPGTGLGMSIVKEIVDLHAGRVMVHSREGVGTEVLLWLPLVGTGLVTADNDAAAPVAAVGSTD